MYAASPVANLLVLRSSDMDRAVTFYRTLGLVFSKHRHGNGPEHYSSTVCDFVFEIYPSRSTDDRTNNTRLGFRVDAVDEIVTLLEEIGVDVVSQATDSPWGRRAVVRDFDGHTVELLTPAKT